MAIHTATQPSRTLPVAAALKDAALAALVAFGLFFFLIGLRTEQGPTGALAITTRLPDTRDPGRRGVRRRACCAR